MTGYDDKQYLLDGEPASTRDIIREAEILDDNFRMSPWKQSKLAKLILKRAGKNIETNPDYTTERTT